MLNIAICDDEPLMCRMLEEKVEKQMRQLEKPFTVRCYNSPEKLLRETCNTNLSADSTAAFPADSVTSFTADILFLDIQMPGIDGISLARRIREEGGNCALIFITVLKECAIDAFEVEAVDYICKPVDDLRLKNAVVRAIKYLSAQKRQQSLLVRKMNRSIQVRLDDIYYCEVIDRKIYLHTVDGVISYYGKIEEAEKELDSRFVKCHRSYLVNLDHLYEYSGSQITLDNQEYIPVSRLRKQEVSRTVLHYMKERGES